LFGGTVVEVVVVAGGFVVVAVDGLVVVVDGALVVVVVDATVVVVVDGVVVVVDATVEVVLDVVRASEVVVSLAPRVHAAVRSATRATTIHMRDMSQA
jgi:hypothetical protein